MRATCKHSGSPPHPPTSHVVPLCLPGSIQMAWATPGAPSAPPDTAQVPLKKVNPEVHASDIR